MTPEGSTKYVYDFHEGSKDMKDLLGGKGANLAEMTNMACPSLRDSRSRPPRASRRSTGGGSPTG